MRFTPVITTRAAITVLGFMLLLAMQATAQETQSAQETPPAPQAQAEKETPAAPPEKKKSKLKGRLEVSAQGVGFFAKSGNGNGLEDHVTNSAMIMFESRFNINSWFAVGSFAGFHRSTQIYSGLTTARVKSNVLQYTPAAVFKLPGTSKIRPFVLAGGGPLIFNPVHDAVNNFPGVKREVRGAFVFGGGADYVLSKHFALRAGFHGAVYQVPDFHLPSLKLNKWTVLSEPSAGIVFRF